MDRTRPHKKSRPATRPGPQQASLLELGLLVTFDRIDLVGAVEKEIKSFKYAVEGIKIAFTSQNNFRIQLVIGITTIIFAFLLRFTRGEWMILLFSIALVLGAELGNTVIEHLVDFVHPNQHGQIKVIKDLSAGIVLLTSLLVAVIGLFLFLPYILPFFK